MSFIDGELAELARAHGVAVSYYDQAGTFREVSAETVLAVLAALGVDALSEEGRAQAWERHRLRNWRRTLPPVFVVRQGQPGRLWVHVPHGDSVAVDLETEEGWTRDLAQLAHDVTPVDVDGVLVGEACFEIPSDLPLGYHTVHARDGVGAAIASCPVIVTPRRLELPEFLVEEPVWGLMAQVYSVRSRMSWGLGDLGDMSAVGEWAAREHGADFLLVNPLHASSPLIPVAPSPYLPVARRFFAPWYVRIEDIPEFDDLPIATQEALEQSATPLRELNASNALLDRDRVWKAKVEALEAIYAIELAPARSEQFAKFRAAEGRGLHDFAVWCALVEDLGFGDGEWPEELRHPHTADVMAAGERLAQRVRFHEWLQWLVDQQLAEATAALAAAGMRVGVVHDLAVGVHPEGSDSWALQDVLARGISVGAPPDMYNQVGQNWSQPPWHPVALAEEAFMPFRDMLRTILRHAGGLRVDHMLGLFRLWWIPDGMAANEGTFVTYDHEALVGILCLEAHRADALVVGEDLGTVEAWVQDYLRDCGVLGTSILWFERREDHSIISPEEWRTLCLSSVSVHDLPPTAGYLAGVHVELRDRLGLLSRPVQEERAAHEAELDEYRALLAQRGLLAPESDHDIDALMVALHAYLGQSPSRLQGVALVDLVGDVVPQNQPGTDQEHPNWRIPVCDGDGRAVVIEDLSADPELAARVARLIAAVRR